MNLIEPTRGVHLVIYLHTMMINSPLLTKIVPILADVFVFSYPVYLGILYILWRTKKNLNFKIASITIFVSVAASIFSNLIIQYFFHKQRPDVVLDLASKKVETLLHKFLPASSFPSDHACVSMSIAMATLYRGIAYKKKWYIYISILLVLFSFTMGLGRMMTAVHRPTDIIGGMLVGIAIPALILFTKPLATWTRNFATWIGEKV